jgi:SpoVK/Ycf46/Vps4 family AAA+-type ATPase
MSSPPPPPEHGRAEESREELLIHLYAQLASYHIERQLREDQKNTARSARAEWRRILRRLEERVVAPEDLLVQVTTMAYAARNGHPLRVLLVGAPGAGKSHIAAAIAAIVGTRTVTLDATAISEAGWSGVSLTEALAVGGAAEQLAGAALVVEELDKIRINKEAHGNALDKYRNQQSQWLSLLDRAGQVALGRETLISGGVHVIATAAFADAPWVREARAGGVSREAMVAYGLLPELIDRIDHVFALTPPSVSELATILRREIERPWPTALEETVKELGFELRIHPSVYPYVAQLVGSRATAGTRGGRALIEAAIQRALARAIRRKLRYGSVLWIRADDIQVPTRPEEPPSGHGRRGGPGRGPVRRR